MTISFRTMNGKRRDDLALELNSYYFGDEFFRLYLQLPTYIAQSARLTARSSARHISEINMYGRRITDRREIKKILDALRQVTSRAFDLYADPDDNVDILLIQKGGSVSRIVLAPHPPVSKSLPASLIPYYNNALASEMADTSAKPPVP